METRRTILLLWAALAAPPAADPLGLSLDTTRDADGAYRTVGTMTLPFPAALVDATMTDFNRYDHWAPRGQDGRDPGSAGYIGQLTGVRAGQGALDLVYRVNLFWPFGSSGQTIALRVKVPPPGMGTVRRIEFTLKSPSFVTPILEGVFSLTEKGPRESRIVLDCRLKLAWFLMPFFPIDAYRTHVVKRLETALRSFADEVALP